jgi:chemotaxis protein MotB
MKINFRLIIILSLAAAFLASCGYSEEEYMSVVKSRDSLESVVAKLNQEIADLNATIAEKNKKIDLLEMELANTQENYNKLKMNSSEQINTLLADVEKMQKDLAAREARLNEVQRKLDARDAAINQLRETVDKALLGFKDLGLSIRIENGKVYVSLADKLLFKSGSTSIDKTGKEALLGLAEVLNQQMDVSIVVEGHTDDVPIKGGTRFTDNWDLSVLRATEVVRYLATEGGVAPQRIVASGRSEYFPVAEGDDAEARAKNRRTEIILTPKLEQLYEILK